jgi:hypothetical protein
MASRFSVDTHPLCQKRLLATRKSEFQIGFCERLCNAVTRVCESFRFFDRHMWRLLLCSAL